jgi:hypothetical protein
MKGFLVAVLIIISINSNAQGFGGLLKKVSGDSSLNKVIGSAAKGKLSTDDIAAGLKEALNVGVRNGTAQLSAADGFFKNAAFKILMPPEALKAEKTLRDMGFSKQVDDAILSMNRAAEDAAKSAAPIFVSAIKQMTIQDAAGILKGGDSAATMYLKQKTALPLTNAFSPIIKESLSKVDATKYWNSVFSTYNKVPFVKKVNTDLNAYVTEKALAGIFYQVALEEQKIRKNPAAQTTDLLKKVFGSK